MINFADNHRRWGYRRALVYARAAGFTIGRDTFRRLWRQEGLKGIPTQEVQAYLG
ncbi:transposase [Corynebacterium phocae]|uniref:IS3 family transposase n=1 Tax=Corynebacterium phocae TaxID=161895 RepID=UPI001238E739|nr:IS3 family transposase [Corynebacterium phocae]KAA8728576.1 transposase [Corynebacterium phocae]